MPEPDTIAMSRRWDELARRDSRFFIATDETDWDEATFFASGRGVVEQVMVWVGDDAPRGRMLEIGCGLGRMLIHFAERYTEAHGIDVSAAMIEQAGSRTLPENVHLHVGSGRDLAAIATGSVDLVYSALVFQHIADPGVIDDYLRETARVLSPGGRAVVHFDTRPGSVLERLYKSLPDPLLPRTHRRFIRRYRRDADHLRARMRAAGLGIADERFPRSPDHLFLLRPAATPDPAS